MVFILLFSLHMRSDRHMAYTIGSAFYGIYFIVSFPMFLRLDEPKSTDLFGTGVCMEQLICTSLMHSTQLRIWRTIQLLSGGSRIFGNMHGCALLA
jgi:hypothetical protein